MISEPDTGRCANEEVESCREWTKGGVPARTLIPEGGGGGLGDPASVGRRTKTPFIRAWKPLPSRRVLKTLRGSPKGESPKRTIFASGGLWAITSTNDRKGLGDNGLVGSALRICRTKKNSIT